MKSLITIAFLIITTSALANNKYDCAPKPTQTKVAVTLKVTTPETKAIARVYKNKNARVTKALKFRTKRNNTKMV